MADSNKKLGVFALAALVVSAMIGGGVFSLPQNMAQDASVVAVMISWLITGIGIFFLVNTFRILSVTRPDATTGIYAYARLGFGRFTGFQMAWLYWLSNIFGNVGYAVLLMDALDYFFPGTFTGGNNLYSIIGGSIIIWVMNFAVLRGMKQASGLNIIGTICKVVPLAIFIIFMIWFFRWKLFGTDMTGSEILPQAGIKPLGSMLSQIRSTMMVTLWVFIGIEGAVVVSGNAESQKAVGKATLLGFVFCLILYFLLSVLPFGNMEQWQLAKLANPSTAGLLQEAVHSRWGGVLMNLGVVIAILSSWLAFTIMIAQIPWAAAQDNTFPVIFRHTNLHSAPDVSLWVSSIVMQLTMIMVYFANNAWNTMLSITSVMILPPYMACTLYLFKYAGEKDFPANPVSSRKFALFCGAAGSLYALWMIYAAGLQYLLMACCFMVLGIPVFLWSRYQHRVAGETAFTRGESIGAALLILIGIIAVILASCGKLSL